MDARYIYCSGRIRARETRLLNYSRLTRLLESADAPAVLRSLADTDYGKALKDVGNEAGFEYVLGKQAEDTYRLVTELTHDPALTDLFFLKTDFHNLKIAFKEKMTGAAKDAADEYFITPCLFSPRSVFNAVREGDFKSLKSPLKESAEKLASLLSSREEVRFIDPLLDNMYFSFSMDVVKRAGNEFVKELFVIQIDLANIKTFIRLKNRDKSYMGKFLIDGGSFERKFFAKLADGSFEDFLNAIRLRNYHDAVRQGVEEWQKRGDFSVLEKLCDDYLLDYAGRAKYITFGPEPLVGYILAKRTEAVNIRIIIKGKINGLRDEVISQSLRKTYV